MQAEHSISTRLPWQESQWQRLVALHSNDKLPHALVLAGPAGVGKKRFALSLAHYLLCAAAHDSKPCGECRQCGFNRAGTHPDLKRVEPEEQGKQIKVDQIRALVESFGQTSQQAGYKITILAPAQAMNINAANSLLKSLEEPTANTLLILITDSPGLLLPTIRSRCQMVTFPIPPKSEALAWLAALLPSSEPVEQLLQEAAGQPISALELLETDGIGRRRQMHKEFMAMLRQSKTALALAEHWLDYDFQEVLSWLGHTVSSVIGFRVANKPLAEDLQAVAGTAEVRSLFTLLDTINQLQGKISRGANPNKQLALEDLLLETCERFHT